MKEKRTEVESFVDVMAHGWRSRTMTKALLVAGIVAAGLYVVGDVVSALIYNGSRPYSFRDQWISELTAYGSPARSLMVTVIIVHDLLLIAFGLGIWRAGRRSRSLRWTGLLLIGVTVLGIVIHPFFPMSSRWMESGFNDTMHGTLSMVWGIITFVAVGLSAVAYRGWFRVYAIATDVILVAFATASGIAIQGLEQNDTPWAGAFERINAYALMAWLVLLAVTVMRRSLYGLPQEQRPSEEDWRREPSLIGTS